MVGAASVLSLSRGRAVALGALIAVLVVFGAGASSLPGLSEDGAIAFASLVVLPAFAAVIWLALPLARAREWYLLGAAAVFALVWIGFSFLDLGELANLAKLVSYILFGFWFLSLFEALWWLVLVALLVPWVDIWSVAAGPTEYVTEQRPEVFDGISVALHVPGETSTANIGPPDVVFFALFLAAAQQFRLRVALTWISMTAFLSLTLLLVYFWDTDGLPALPAVCWGFLLPNLDLLWRDVRGAYATRGQEAK